MAIVNGYCTLAELRAKIDYTASNTTDDAELESVIEAASRNIDDYTRRVFYQLDGATRYYTPTHRHFLRIDDIRTFTSVDVNGVTWVKDTDFYATPYNPKTDYPWTGIETILGKRLTVGVQRSVTIVGDFGWQAVPPQIKQATLLEASRLHARRTAPFGVAGQQDTGIAFLGAVNDPQARVLANPFVVDPLVMAF